MVFSLGWLCFSRLTRAEQLSLSVQGYQPAIVVPPLLKGKRPVVVALHGNFDRPEWNCNALVKLGFPFSLW
jgi:poly(3-hydroxybutyrate) depolymerase